MSEDKREPRSIVFDGPMPPAEEPAGVVGTPLPRNVAPSATEPEETSLGGFYDGSLGEAYEVDVERRLSARDEILEHVGNLFQTQPLGGDPQDRRVSGRQRAIASTETRRIQAQMSQEYHSIQQLVRLMREVGLTNQTILGVLNGVPRAVDMAQSTLSLQAPAQEFSLRNTYLRASEAVTAVAGSPAANAYLRAHLEELTRAQSYDEITQLQEHRRDEQTRILQERLMASRLGDTPRPSDEIMQRLVERQASQNPLSTMLVNRQQMEDIQRWGRDEIDEGVRRNLMGVSMITTPAREEHQDHARLREQIQREVDILYDWAWVEITNRVLPASSMTDTIAHSRRELEHFNEATRLVFDPFGIRATIGFNEESICRENMQLALRVDGPHGQDIHGRMIVGSLTWHPAILMVFNQDGRYDFANYGHRQRTTPTPRASDPDARADHLRGRDGGSSSHAADGDAPRRNRLLNLDL